MNYGQYKVPPANEFVKFGVGQPAPTMLPLDTIKLGMQNMLEIQDPLAKGLVEQGQIWLQARKDGVMAELALTKGINKTNQTC